MRKSTFFLNILCNSDDDDFLYADTSTGNRFTFKRTKYVKYFVPCMLVLNLGR